MNPHIVRMLEGTLSLDKAHMLSIHCCRMAGITQDGSLLVTEGQSINNCRLTVCEENISPWCQPCYCDAGIKTKAEWFCPECNMFICSQCYDVHEDISTTIGEETETEVDIPDKEAWCTCYAHDGHLRDCYCIHHNEIVCSMCIKDNHQYCYTIPIATLCKTVRSEDMKQFSDLTKTVKTSIGSTKSELEYNIRDIEDHRRKMIKAAKGIRDRIILKAERLYADTVVNINDVCNQKTSNIFSNVTCLSEMIDSLEETIPDIDNMTYTCLNPVRLTRMQAIVEDIKQYKREAEEIYKQLTKVELTLSLNPDLDTFVTETNQLGDIKEKSFCLAALKPLPEIIFPCCSELCRKAEDERKGRCLSQIDITKMTPLKVKMAEDFLCIINGMDITRDGNLLLADWNNKKVKLFSPDNKLLFSLLLADNPFAIAVINEKTAAVSTNDKSLHILDISDPNSVSVQSSLHLGYLVTGMTPVNGNLVVTRWSKPTSVKMVDVNGREIWSVSTDQSGQTLFKKPRSVVSIVKRDQTRIVVTDWGKDTLTVLDAKTGKHIKTIDVEEKAPHGITADNEGNVYVCYFHTKEICVWSKDFKESRTLLSGNMLSSGPRDILYNNITDELFVSYRITDQADKFQLSFPLQ